MKKILVATLFVAGVGVGLNAENLSDERFYQLIKDCWNENMNSCQRLIDSNSLESVEQCNKETCGVVGYVYGKAENYQQAIKYYKKACELNDEIGCSQLAISYDRGQGVKQNFAEAFKFYKKACDLNKTLACFAVGIMYDEGKGVKQDFVNARKYYEKACEANYARACSNLTALYFTGQGVKQNLSIAKKYAGKACDLGEQMGCDKYRILNEQGVK